MLTEIRKRSRDRRQRASMTGTIAAASQTQRDELRQRNDICWGVFAC